ncbi:MAG TPA: hypothetical protein VHV31_14250 [Nitrolancea sp.]|jgi:hypothetical protein|nr:hypothetical protein [Nitrolancea sp.]
MAQAHGGLGELIVLLYLVIAILSFVLAKRNGLPAWVTGTAHALLAVQILMGIILFIRYPHAMPVSHVIAALLTIPAIGLMVPLRKRIGKPRAVGVSALTVTILAMIAVIIAKTR